MIEQAKKTETLHATRCVAGQQKYRWCDFDLGGGAYFLDEVPHTQKYWCPPHDRMVRPSPWDGGPIGLRCVLDDGVNSMHMGVYWDNITADGTSNNKIPFVEDERQKGRPDVHEGKATLGGFSEFFSYKASHPTNQAKFNVGLNETDDLFDYCSDVIEIVTDEFCYLWNTGYSEPKIKHDYNKMNDRENPLSYLGSNEMIGKEVQGGGVEDFVGGNDHHKNLLTVAIHVRLADVADCGNQRGLEEIDFDFYEQYLRELKCGSGAWSEKHPSPAYINYALSLIDEVMKPNAVRIVIVSDARKEVEFQEIQKIIDHAHTLKMAHHVDPNDEDSTKVLFLDADVANPEQALDVLATEADICIVGGSSFAFLATLFGRCATVVPAGVSFVEEFSEVIDTSTGEPVKDQTGFLAHRSVILPSPERAAGASYFGSGTSLAEGEKMTEDEREAAKTKLLSVLHNDVRADEKIGNFP